MQTRGPLTSELSPTKSPRPERNVSNLLLQRPTEGQRGRGVGAALSAAPAAVETSPNQESCSNPLTGSRITVSQDTTPAFVPSVLVGASWRSRDASVLHYCVRGAKLASGNTKPPVDLRQHVTGAEAPQPAGTSKQRDGWSAARAAGRLWLRLFGISSVSTKDWGGGVLVWGGVVSGDLAVWGGNTDEEAWPQPAL